MTTDLSAFRRIAEVLPEPTLLVSLDGRVEAANRAFTASFGWRSSEVAGTDLSALAATPAAGIAAYLKRCARTSTFLPGALLLRQRDGVVSSCMLEGAAFRTDDGSQERLVLVRLQRKQSAIRRFVDLNRQTGDLTAEVVRRRKAERTASEALDRERRVRERLAALTDASSALVASPSPRDVLPAIGRLVEGLIAADAYAVWRSDPATGEWRIVWGQHLSDSFVAAISGWSAPDGSDGFLTEPLFVEDVDAVPRLADRKAAYLEEGIRSLMVMPLRVDEVSYGSAVAYYRTPVTIGSDDRRVAVALCNFASSVLTMATLYERESVSREAAEKAAEMAEHGAEFLAKAGTVLASSLDYEATLQAVARFAVPEMADWCAVDVVSDGGGLKRLAVAHADPAKIALARELQARYPEDPTSPYGPAEAIRTTRPVLMPRIREELIVRGARDPEHLRIIRALGLTSYMCVPLVVRGHALGVLTFVSAESGRVYGDPDLRLAEEVASRAALAVENARAYEQAQQASRLKDEFLATLSHELRTPLNAVLGYARMIRSGVLSPEKQARAVEVVERNAIALNRIIEDVLDVSRIIAGKIRLNVQPVDLAVVLHDAATTVLPAADAKGVRVETIVNPSSPLISGDPERLLQIVWNLLSNAVKFTPRGGHVQLRLEQAGSQVQIVVTDTGIGMPRDFLPHLFEPFRQADSRFAREHGGLGLGLGIARHIVEMHGGTITAESAGEGQGATFVVRFPALVATPRVESGQVRAGVDLVAPDPPQAPSPVLQGIRVLAVDDDVDALELVTAILEAAGAQVRAAGSAAAAMDLLAHAELPDILVTDIGMPGMDGFELMARIRQWPHDNVRRVPAVALTAYAWSEDRTRALESGYQMHLAKPISPAELIAAIRALAGSRGESALAGDH